MDVAIAFAIFGAVWWGMARYWRTKGKGALVRHSCGLSIGFCAMIIFVIIVAPKETPPVEAKASSPTATDEKSNIDPVALNAPSAKETPAEPIKQTPVSTLDLTPDQYAKRFNKLMAEMEQPFRIKPKVEKGAVKDTFTARLNDHLGVIGGVDKTTGKLVDVMFMGSGDGTAASGMRVIMTSVATLAAAAPEGSIKVVSPIVMEMFEEGKKNEGKSTRIFNNVKFRHSSDDLMGTLFSAEAI